MLYEYILHCTWSNIHLAWSSILLTLNTLRPRQNDRHFVDHTFKRIFLYENVGIWIKISLKFVHKGPINNIPAFVQIMAWRWPGDKPLSEQMVGSLLMHICVTWPQWVNMQGPSYPSLTRSISWLLMPWILASPRHQHPWHWLCKIGKFLSYTRKDFNCLCTLIVEE